MWKRIGIFLLFVATVAVGLIGSGASVTYAANGTGPGDAVTATGAVQTVPANSQLWYSFELGGAKRSLAVTLDAASSDGLQLSIYTPDEIAAWQRGDEL